MYDFDISEEKPIKIKALLQYPVAGVQGFEVSSLEMTESGPLYDRIWAIIKTANLKHKSLSNSTDTMMFK